MAFKFNISSITIKSTLQIYIYICYKIFFKCRKDILAFQPSYLGQLQQLGFFFFALGVNN